MFLNVSWTQYRRQLPSVWFQPDNSRWRKRSNIRKAKFERVKT